MIQISPIISHHLLFSFADHARCNAWVLDGDLYHKGLQKFAMCVENLANSLAVLMVDLSRPWLALDSLHKWTSVLRDYLDKLRVPPETMRELEHRCKCVCLCGSVYFSSISPVTFP